MSTTLPLNPVATWTEPVTVAQRMIRAVLYLDADGWYRHYDTPHATTAGFEVSGGNIIIVPGSTAPLTSAHFADGTVRTFL